jgi:hypothetical protein
VKPPLFHPERFSFFFVIVFFEKSGETKPPGHKKRPKVAIPPASCKEKAYHLISQSLNGKPDKEKHGDTPV